MKSFIFVLTLLITMSVAFAFYTDVCAEQQTFSFTLNKSDSIKTISGFYDTKRGVVVINTRGGMDLGPVVKQGNLTDLLKQPKEVDKVETTGSKSSNPLLDILNK